MPENQVPPRETASSIWKEFALWEGREFPNNDTPLPIDPAYPLFGQTVQAFDSGSLDLAAMGCRAAVEAIGYTFMSRRPTRLYEWQNSAPKGADGRPRRVDFPEVAEFIKNNTALDSDLIDALDRIKFAGDATAHVASRLEEEVETILNNRRRRPGGPTDPLQLWMRPDDVRKNLVDAVEILKAVLLAARQERDRWQPGTKPV